MKISILQETFKVAIDTVKPALSSRSTLEVLSNLLLTAEGERLTVVANNFELAIAAPLSAKIEQAGATTVPGKLLAELVSNLPPERVDLELDEATQRLHLRCGRIETRLATIPADEFPALPHLADGAGWLLSGEQLRKLIRQTVFAAATDEARPVFTGVLLRISETGLLLAAADGFRLSKTEANGQADLTPGEVIIPAAALAQVARLIDDETETVRVRVDRRQVSFEIDGVTLTTQLIEGEFPDFSRIIPSGHTTRATVAVGEFRRALKMGNLFARDAAGLIVFKFDPDGFISLEAHSSESGDSAADIAASVEGEPLVVKFNGKYVLDALNAIEGEQLVIEASTAMTPGVFRSPADDAFLHVIMPMGTN